MMNHDNLSALKAFAPQYYEQSPTTISLADTSLMTPSTPAASVRSSSVGPQSQPQSAKKQVKKRKSWGQELPVPKTNLPPRYACPLTASANRTPNCSIQKASQDR